MKILYFIRWCLDWRSWYPFQRRYTIYGLITLALMFINTDLVWIGVVMILGDLVGSLIRDKWNSFCREQKNMIKNLKGKR